MGETRGRIACNAPMAAERPRWVVSSHPSCAMNAVRLSWIFIALAAGVFPGGVVHAGLIAGSIYGTTVAVGSYTYRGTENEYLKETLGNLAGQTHNLHDPYWFHRAFVVFDLPKLGDNPTPEELGIDPSNLGGATQVSVQVTSSRVVFDSIQFAQFPIEDLPVDIRLSALPADALVNGTIDPETAFHGLGGGTTFAQQVVPFDSGWTDYRTDYSIDLNSAFTHFLANRDGGEFVLSITIPFLPNPAGDGYEFINVQGPFLENEVLFSPVPEPATYGIAGGLFCVVLAGLRRRGAIRGGF